jgi:2OG-Fe(II) oxygenase superfamily
MVREEPRMARPQITSVFDGPVYPALAAVSSKVYQSAEPFPHIMLDNFLPHDDALAIAAQFPQPDNTAWTSHASKRVNRQFLGDETKYPPLFRQFTQATSSRRFLLFLEALSGIKGLIPDPYFVGGGAMTAGRGHKLDMHIDFNWHYNLHVHRRLNALFYLTPDWRPEWGGNLFVEGSIVRSYAPLFNRLIVFSTAENSWHGQPIPLTCPKDVSRNVFSAFYYTAASPAQEADPHLTKYHEETPYTAAPLKDYMDRQ